MIIRLQGINRVSTRNGEVLSASLRELSDRNEPFFEVNYAINASSCDRCGCLVIDQAKHIEWHAALE